MVYVFYKVDDTGVRTDGVTLTGTGGAGGGQDCWDLFAKVSDGTVAATPPPTISEVVASSGIYKFTYVPTEQVFFEIDLGSDVDDSIRYLRGMLDPSDEIADQLEHLHTSSEIKRKQIYYSVADISPNRNVQADKPSHIKVEVNQDGDLYDFTTPDTTYYIILEYYTLGDSAPANQVIATAAPTDGTFYVKTIVT